MITSRHNSRLQFARRVRDGREKDFIFIEGLRLCEEAARTGLSIEEVFFTENITRDDRGATMLEELSCGTSRATTPWQVREDILAGVSDTKNSQGLIIIARRPECTRQSFADLLPAGPLLLVVLHRINNPANAGALIRVAEAAGAGGAIATSGSTDLFSPKALRGAMGSSFRLPLWDNVEFQTVLDWCAGRNISTISTDLRADRVYTDIDWTTPVAIVLGPEAAGLSSAEVAATNLSVRIPMRPPVESLNVATALAVVCYEAERQRNTTSLPKAKSKR